MRCKTFRDDPPDESQRERDLQEEVEQIESDEDMEPLETGDVHHLPRTARDAEEELDDIRGGEA